MFVTSTRRLATVAAVFPLLIAGGGQAATTPVTVALEYSATPACPEVGAFKEIVIGQLGDSPFLDSAGHHVRVSIVPADQNYEGRIEWRDADGTWKGDRAFHSKSGDCFELARAMGFALAVQIRLSAAEKKIPTEIPPAATPSTKEIPPPIEPTPPPPEPAPTPPPDTAKSQIVLGAGGRALLGLSPGTIPAGRVFAAWRWPYVALEASADASLPATVRRIDGAGFSHQDLLASVAGCGVLRFVDACLVAKAGRVRIVGKDIDVPASPSGTAVQTGLRIAARAPLGNRVYLAAVAEGLLMATQWKVTIDSTQVWSSPRFIAALGLDVGVRIR